jgi:hypothetical protein
MKESELIFDGPGPFWPIRNVRSGKASNVDDNVLIELSVPREDGEHYVQALFDLEAAKKLADSLDTALERAASARERGSR